MASSNANAFRQIHQDFHIAYSLASNGAEVFVMAGLPYKVLVEEAHETAMPIRLRETKGMVGARSIFHDWVD
eukprot:SAG31_NODE_12856_length_911_cov_1.136700_2_plen_72_part_00